MDAAGWLSTVAGVALVGYALRDVFHTLLHPSGVGEVSPLVMRATWRMLRPLVRRRRAVAGPAGVALVIASWAAAVAVGWALVYLPHLPEGFVVAPGVEPDSGFLTALYVSLESLSTLGFGDFVAATPALRLASASQALFGFALLTVTISWILELYPALLRRRVLSRRIALILEPGDDPRFRPQGSGDRLAVVLDGLVDQLLAVEVDLLQLPSTFFFHDTRTTYDSGSALRSLRQAASASEVPEAARPAATAVVAAVDAIGQRLLEGPFGIDAETPAGAIEAYAHSSS